MPTTKTKPTKAKNQKTENLKKLRKRLREISLGVLTGALTQEEADAKEKALRAKN